MTIGNISARFCSMTSCGKDICSCRGHCLHTGMCCYNKVQYSPEAEESYTKLLKAASYELGGIGRPMTPMVPILKRRVPYYVTECIRTFAGMY